MDAAGAVGVTPISPTGKINRTRAHTGFTLIELLTVVAIIAVLAIGVGLTVGGAFGGLAPVDRLAARLDQTVGRTRDEALYQRAALGLWPLADGWQVLRLHSEDGWFPVGAAHRQPGAVLSWESVALALVVNPRTDPPIRFAPDGGATGFSVALTLGGQTRQCRLLPTGLECD